MNCPAAALQPAGGKTPVPAKIAFRTSNLDQILKDLVQIR